MSRSPSHAVSSSRTRAHEAPVSSSRSRALDSTVQSSRSRSHDIPVSSSRSRANDSTVGCSRSRAGEHTVIGSEHRRSQASSSSRRDVQTASRGHSSNSRSSNDIASCFGRSRGGELTPYQGSSVGRSSHHSSSHGHSQNDEGTVARREPSRRYEGSARLGDELARYHPSQGAQLQGSRTKIEINQGNQQIKITVEEVNVRH
ncbi:hypothetical protein B0A52_09262 [Exophiala mesophila]|uniref:Uncharacterized protein n=1 Tax=Exophiala mesophila TaxID=212818 RepID=A0A438MU19_EXOME|nr:hypothetical protein B0A52_09262 [Exophiala mesophila]